MSRGGLKRVFFPVRFPRVSGDEPAILDMKLNELAFSPRERG